MTILYIKLYKINNGTVGSNLYRYTFLAFKLGHKRTYDTAMKILFFSRNTLNGMWMSLILVVYSIHYKWTQTLNLIFGQYVTTPGLCLQKLNLVKNFFGTHQEMPHWNMGTIFCFTRSVQYKSILFNIHKSKAKYISH